MDNSKIRSYTFQQIIPPLLHLAAVVVILHHIQQGSADGMTQLSMALASLFLWFAVLSIGTGVRMLCYLRQGFRFNYLKIAFLYIYQSEGKVKAEPDRRMSPLCIVGTKPPEGEPDKIASSFTRLSGGITLLLLALAGLLVLLLAPFQSTSAFLVLTVTLFAAAEGLGILLPLKLYYGVTAGYIAVDFRNLSNRKAYQHYMKSTHAYKKGMGWEQMSEEELAMPMDTELNSAYHAELGYLACVRALHRRDLSKAEALCRHMLEVPTGMTGNTRRTVQDMLLFCLMLQNPQPTQAEKAYYTQRFYQIQSKIMLNVMIDQTRYAHMLLNEDNQADAYEFRKRFDEIAAMLAQNGKEDVMTAPRALLDLVEQVYQQRKMDAGEAANL